MKHSFFMVFLLLVFPGAVRAVGIDCAVANTAREHLVCEDKTLSATEEQMNQAYTAALDRLSPEGGKILQESQLGWSRYVDRFCPITGDPAQRTEAISCVLNAYTDRIGDIQQAIVQKGPFLFSRVDVYAVSDLGTQANQDDKGLASHHVAYPRVDQPTTPQTALWNALVVRKDHPSACDGGDGGDTWTDYSLNLATANLISITWTVYDYCHGRPHGFGAGEAQTLVLSPQPHPLTPGDLFQSGAPWAERLTTLLLAGVRQAAKDEQLTFDESQAWYIAEVARDTQRWSLGTDGLGYQFNAYEIGPYTFQPYVVIPWINLRDVMVPSSLVP